MGGLAATGVFAIVVIGAAIALTHLSLGPASGPESRPAVGAPAPNPAPGSHVPNVPRPQARGGPANTVGLPSGIYVAYGAASRKLTALAFATREDFTPRNIANGVRSAISTSVTFSTAGPMVPNSESPIPSPSPSKVGTIGVGQIARCLSAVAASNGVLVVEIAHYQGKPAMIIVSKPISGFYRVTVTGLACSASRPDVLARITVSKAR